MKTKVKFNRIAELVYRAPRDIRILLELTGLNPATDFKNLDLRNVDFSGCDLTGFNFTGSWLEGCRFSGARLSGATFDAKHQRLAHLFEDALDVVAFPGPSIIVGGERLRRLSRPTLNGEVFYCGQALAKLGVEVWMLCPLGEELTATGKLVSALSQIGVSLQTSARSGSPGNCVIEYGDGGAATLRISGGFERMIRTVDAIAALPSSFAALHLASHIFESTYDTTAWLEVATEAARRGATVTLDLRTPWQFLTEGSNGFPLMREVLRQAHVIAFLAQDVLPISAENAETFMQEVFRAGNCDLFLWDYGETVSAITRNTRVRIPVRLHSMPGYRNESHADFIAGTLKALLDRGVLRRGELNRLDEQELVKVLQFATSVVMVGDPVFEAGHPLSVDRGVGDRNK